MSATMVTPATDVVLSIEGLALQESALQGLDFTMRAGETAALLGDDQVLLTRIIRVLGGLERPAAGTVTLLGVDVGAATRHQLLQLRRRVGYISVAGGLLSNMTVRENVEIAMRYHAHGDVAGVPARAAALLEEGGLTAMADQPASVIPAEYQKCAAYVRAIASDPPVVLVEDPAAFLHPEGRTTIERIHARLQDTQTTVLLADDDTELASRLVARAVWFSGATITFDGPFSSLPSPAAMPGQTAIP